MPQTVTLEQVRAELRRTQKTQSALAREIAKELDVSSEVVRHVLSGRIKGARGDARKIAVRLGLIADEEKSATQVIDDLRNRNRGAA